MSLNWDDHSPDNTEKLSRALGYPYDIPDHSYIVHNDSISLMRRDEAVSLRQGRTPVLAVGSNQSPAQMMRKFRGPDWHPIPCERCIVHDFDTVFSAHIAHYGSVAATLHPSIGTAVTLFINWLHEDHIPRMHATELGNENYVFAELEDIKIETEFGLDLSRVYFYRGNAGAFAPDGTPIPLAEVAAENRKWKAHRQTDIQGKLHQLLLPDIHLEEFILSAISDSDTRQKRANFMRENVIHFEHPSLKVIKDEM